MPNPFEQRATEFLREDEAFLSVVTPEPLFTYLQEPARSDTLYNRLAIIVGTPGSGKTTLARLFEYSTISTLLRSPGTSTNAPIVDALQSCGALDGERPLFISARIPLESEYRDIWEFPYPSEMKLRLMIGLIEARAVLSLLRMAQSTGADLDAISIIGRAQSPAAIEAIGGPTTAGIMSRARAVERSLYGLTAALVPPPLEALPEAVGSAYHPLDVFDAIEMDGPGGRSALRPLLIFDDAHTLHPEQFSGLRNWLSRREMRTARWVLTRVDALDPSQVLFEGNVPTTASTVPDPARDLKYVYMQETHDRSRQRRAFRKMARDMSARYLSQMDVFARRRLNDLAGMLQTDIPGTPPSELAKLARAVAGTQRRVRASDGQRVGIERQVGDYLAGKPDDRPEIHLMMTNILLERFGKRAPVDTLWDLNDEELELTRPLTADSTVLEAARVQLMHRSGRAYYVGFDQLCDVGNENAEQFLHLAGGLVSLMETQLIRGRAASLDARAQHTTLRKQAREIIDRWDFPFSDQVGRLIDVIAQDCLARTLEGNASLGGGATAWGIPMDDFVAIPTVAPQLALVLQYGVAYNAIVLVPGHSTKHKMWCLIELGGAAIAAFGLTTKRGGFNERGLANLVDAIGGTP